MANTTHSADYQPRTSQRVRISVGSNETTPWYPVNSTGSVAVKPSAGTMRAEITSSPLALVMKNNMGDTADMAMAFAWPAR